MIDVLRASTTIAAALHSGAKEIIPVASVENAVKVSRSLFGDVTLRGGERGGKVIKGFNLGNSPSEYTEEAVRGKSIIYTTTNGSAALVKARYAQHVVVGGFVNFSRVVGFLRELKSDFILLCAGRENEFSLEDTVCAGMILTKLQRVQKSLQLDDAGKAAMILAKALGSNVHAMLEESAHGKFLIDFGLGNDLEICAALDSIPVLPVMSDSVIRLSKDKTQREAAP